MKTGRPAVEFENVTVSYTRGNPILRNLSFSIFEGELIFLLGPNGGGKSTVLKTMVGALKPENGVVRLFGVGIEKFRSWWMIGYLPQNAATFFENMPLNVSELLNSTRHRGRGMSPEEALNLVGVEDHERILGMRVTDLSGGMLQKVMTALALINRPRLLLLDEPTVYIDQPGVRSFIQLLQKLHSEWGLTTVIATHDVAAISIFASRVICINREALFDGSIEELTASEQLCSLYGFHVYTLRHGHRWSEK
ncbi:Zinc import ATP-binding protein ZnuC [archaeon HR01]|nr:Zinc import ATP-binding protein ZnuC [archaeon HR01]